MATCTDKNIKEVREKWQRDLFSSIMTEILLKRDGPLNINVDKRTLNHNTCTVLGISTLIILDQKWI